MNGDKFFPVVSMRLSVDWYALDRTHYINYILDDKVVFFVGRQGQLDMSYKFSHLATYKVTVVRHLCAPP